MKARLVPKLKWPVKHEDAEYMRMRQRQNRAVCKYSNAENWMRDKLLQFDLKWTRQCWWGYRLFDFWNHKYGIAVEVDGPEHKKGVDAYRDKYNFNRSGIIVLRVQNFSEANAQAALDKITQIIGDGDLWSVRRERLKCKSFLSRENQRLKNQRQIQLMF